MCGNYFINDKNLREIFERANKQKEIEGYHVHIYFDPANPAEEAVARELAEEVRKAHAKNIDRVAKVGSVGPHTKPNIELDVTKEGAEKIFDIMVTLKFLNRGRLSILIHPETGDDLQDHLGSSIWIGNPVPYNQAFFERLIALKKPDAPKP